MVSHSLCARMNITPERLGELCAYVGFGPEDARNLRQVRKRIVGDLDRIITRFCMHLRQFEDLRPFLEEGATLRRLQRTVRKYLLTLGKGIRTPGYAEMRLRIGLTHERIGLGLNRYMGSCPFLLGSIARALASDATAGVERKLPALLTSLQKALAIDSILVVEAYHQASTQRMEQVLEEQRVSQERLYQENRMDGLTQVLNKQTVMTNLEAELARCRSQNLPFTMLILDVDHFKQVNDEHGHPFGDFVLRHVADIVRRAMRPGDIVGRFGGDEIIVGLGGCEVEDAAKIAERIRRKVGLAPFRSRGQRARVTLSIGIAPFSLRAPRLDRIIDEADQALYRAKQAGRNRTRLADNQMDAGGTRL